MSLLLTLHHLSKSFGSQELFEDLSFTIEVGEKIGLTGPNGSGKSTLLKIIFGIESQDEGHISKKQGLTVAYAGQFPVFKEDQTALDVLTAIEDRVKATAFLEKSGFSDPDVLARDLSGGWKKRLDILRCFIQDPDLILLDEPTNHLDLDGIKWLEEFLKKTRTTYLIVSHDRRLLDRACSKIIELNRCFQSGVFIAESNWQTFLERKKIFLDGELERQRSLSGMVRSEIDWLQRSPKARTTKSKARIDRAHNLIDELSSLKQRNQNKKADIDFSASERQTRHLVVCKNLTKSLSSKALFKGVDLVLSPGTRLGIVGKNGSGKSTLLKILSGEIIPDLGTIKYAPDLQVVYFDQHRETLDLSLSLKDALSPKGDFVSFRGQEIHVSSWANRFLFPKDKLNLSISLLSGGERARILIARLMQQPADVLLLDEPTNDLDIPTLEIIEKSLLEFPGAVVLITHDRYLMDQVCNQVIALGTGSDDRLFADVSQWEKSITVVKEEKIIKQKVGSTIKSNISFSEKKELSEIEGKILLAESELNKLQALLEETPVKKDLYVQMGEIQKNIDYLYVRWQFLLDKSLKS